MVLRALVLRALVLRALVSLIALVLPALILRALVSLIALLLVVRRALRAFLLGLLELGELLGDEVAVVRRVRVVRIDRQRRVVRLERALPDRDRRGAILVAGLLSEPISRVAEVVVRVELNRRIVGVERLLEALLGAGEVAVAIQPRAVVVRLHRPARWSERRCGRLAGRGGGGQRWHREHRECERRQRRALRSTLSASIADRELEEKAPERERERDLEPLRVHLARRTHGRGLGELRARLIVEGGEPATVGAEEAVRTAGRRRDRSQRRLVESRGHGLSALVAHEVARTVRADDLEELPARAAHTERVDRESTIRGVAGGGDRVPLEILTIADEDHHLLMTGLRAQRLLGCADRGREVGSATRDDVGVERVERFEEHAGVGGEGRLDERVARERDEPEAVAVEPLREIGDGDLGSRQSIRSQIGRAHAPRRVHREHDIDPAAWRLFESIAMERPRERDRDHRHARDDEPVAEPAPASRERGAGTCRGESPERGTTQVLRADQQRRDRDARDGADPEPMWLCEFDRHHVS